MKYPWNKNYGIDKRRPIKNVQKDAIWTVENKSQHIIEQRILKEE